VQVNVAPECVWQIASALEFRVPGARDIGALPLHETIVHGQGQRGHLLRLAFPRSALVDILSEIKEQTKIIKSQMTKTKYTCVYTIL